MHSPIFWKEKGLISSLLLPASCVYNFVAKWERAKISPTKTSIPVICIGNLVAGGAGKTPIAIAIGKMLKELGKHPHYLSRGYKGNYEGVVQVDPHKHNALEVGDEPLLLAQILPTWVAKDRVAGAQAAIAAGADIIIMDDGFQNPSLYKDVSLLVIDGEYGFGNNRIIPAGPIREEIAPAMERASAVIIVGEDKNKVLPFVPPDKPILQAKIVPSPSAYFLKDKDIIAFAGIARPRKFYRTLQQIGCEIRKMVAYQDHHQFTNKDIADLRRQAKELDAILVTTTKDFVRLPEDFKQEVSVVAVEMQFADNAALLKLLPFYSGIYTKLP